MTERANAARAAAELLADQSVDGFTGDLSAEEWIWEFASAYVKTARAKWPEDNPHLSAAHALVEIERACRAQLDITVLQAKEAGASWADIGRKLEMSKQAAHYRWGNLVPPDPPRQREELDLRAVLASEYSRLARDVAWREREHDRYVKILDDPSAAQGEVQVQRDRLAIAERAVDGQLEAFAQRIGCESIDIIPGPNVIRVEIADDERITLWKREPDSKEAGNSE